MRKYGLSFISIDTPCLGSFSNLKRNQVKLHDNVIRILQERDEEKKERMLQTKLLAELRDEVKLLVSVFFPYIIIINDYFIIIK